MAPLKESRPRYCLQTRMRATVEVIVGVLRVKRPHLNPRTSWAQVSCFQKRMWVTAEVLVHMSRVWTDAEDSLTYAYCFQKRTLASAEVLVGLSRAGRLGSNAAIS